MNDQQRQFIDQIWDATDFAHHSVDTEAALKALDAAQAELRAEVERLQGIEFIHNGCAGLREADNAHLIAERDRAREECGHEKAMRASQREELMRYFGEKRAAEAEVARLTTLLEQRTAALTRTIDAKNTAEAKVARVRAASRQNAVQATALARRTDRALNALDALIETVERDDSGEPVCHDYDRIDNGECALLADLRRIKAALTPKETA